MYLSIIKIISKHITYRSKLISINSTIIIEEKIKFLLDYCFLYTKEVKK